MSDKKQTDQYINKIIGKKTPLEQIYKEQYQLQKQTWKNYIPMFHRQVEDLITEVGRPERVYFPLPLGKAGFDWSKR